MQNIIVCGLEAELQRALFIQMFWHIHIIVMKHLARSTYKVNFVSVPQCFYPRQQCHQYAFSADP